MSSDAESNPSQSESERVDRIPVPVYNPQDQVHAAPTDEAGDYRTPGLYAVAKEWTRARREIQGETQFPFSIVGGMGLAWAVDNTSADVGKHFQVHGFSNQPDMHSLDSILTNGIQTDRILYTMPLIRAGEAFEAFGAEVPKTEGGIYLISGYDGNLSAEEGHVQYVGVGEEYNRVIDEMRVLYPQVQIVPWHELPSVLTEAANQATGQQLQAEKLTDENKPHYPVKGDNLPPPVESSVPLRPGVPLKDIAVW